MTRRPRPGPSSDPSDRPHKRRAPPAHTRLDAPPALSWCGNRQQWHNHEQVHDDQPGADGYGKYWVSHNHKNMRIRQQNQNSMSSLSDAQAAPKDERSRMFTWNVWSRAQREVGWSDTHEAQRRRALLREIKRHLGLACALQEVDVEFKDELMRDKRVRRDYIVITGVVKDEDDGVLLLVNKRAWGPGSKVVWAPLRHAPGERARGSRKEVVGAILRDYNGQEKLRIATVHCSSMPVNENLRRKQYETTMRVMSTNSLPKTVIVLLLDTNAASESEFEVFVRAGYEDVERWNTVRKHGRKLMCSTCAKTQCRCKSTLTDKAPNKPRCHEPDKDNAAPAEPDPRIDVFRQNPTFGQLYPYVPTKDRRKIDTPERKAEWLRAQKPRKPRRIDRILIKGGSCSITKWTTAIGVDPVEWDVESGRRKKPMNPSGNRVEELTGQDGFMWPSDHQGVAIDVLM